MAPEMHQAHSRYVGIPSSTETAVSWVRILELLRGSRASTLLLDLDTVEVQVRAFELFAEADVECNVSCPPQSSPLSDCAQAELTLN